MLNSLLNEMNKANANDKLHWLFYLCRELKTTVLVHRESTIMTNHLLTIKISKN